MTNDKKGLTRYEFIGMLFNRFFWLIAILGVIEIVLLQRVLGWVMLIGAILCLLFYYAKINKWGPFKPTPKVSQKTAESPPLRYLSIVRVFMLLFIFLFAFSAIFFGWRLHQQVKYLNGGLSAVF